MQLHHHLEFVSFQSGYATLRIRCKKNILCADLQQKMKEQKLFHLKCVTNVIF